MSEHSYLLNGRFLHNLNGWSVSANTEYSAGDADQHYGVCVLPTGGEYIEQDFAVAGVRLFSLQVSVKPVGIALSAGQCVLTITDGDGNAVVTQDLSGGADSWTENIFSLGLAEGTTYTLQIANVSAAGNVKLDDIWLWFVPLTRAEIAERVHDKLGRLAGERGFSTTASGTATEGSYTYAIDAGLRAVGAIDPVTGLPDVRYLDEQTIQTALDYIERQVLEKLQKDYAVEVDTSTGPYNQRLSQKREAIDEMLGGGSNGDGGSSIGVVVVRPMTYD